MVHTDAAAFVSGYVDSDVDGNYFVDVSDVSIVYNNAAAFVTAIGP
ncbi:MAG: hypothetical protein SGI89_06705 [bacterium]|nr:hypothetical protein [bacterium]